ncbi:helix-turn-helix domain-containing protein [Streptomyces canus]|uniref:helix-turn-helix domain-containing protein n=1 Tax=Streptomyces canus TaxID=58343 RepID=UPI000370128D|nr:helix-turn-helix domain-containing protein [Streptomyces canus]
MPNTGTSGSYSTGSDRTPSALGAYLRGWRDLARDDFSMPAFTPATRDGFRGSLRLTRLHDVAVTESAVASAVRTTGPPVHTEDAVRLWVVHRGEWSLGNTRDETEHHVPAGAFVLRRVGPLSHFATPPHTTARVFILPGAAFTPLLDHRVVTGPAHTSELRLLLAHAGLVRRTLPGLGPAGVEAARNALVELARAVALQGLDATEPALAPALVQAAKEMAETRLTEAGLSAAALAKDLNVSVRTLQRAFAAQEQSVSAYLRERRLDHARRALLAGPGRWSVSEIAAHWQFADSSHFTRLFKRRYGRTPTEYLRVLDGATLKSHMSVKVEADPEERENSCHEDR